ncbi:MAG: hypothetical protein ABL883_08595 [Terricaulis sp.]
MSDDARLARAMAAATPKARDQAFILAVLERAEAERFRLHRSRALLRGAGYAAALVGLLWPAMTLVPAEALVEGLVGSACLAAFVLFVRRTVNA